MIFAYTFGEMLWTMLIFFFWMMAIWIFISLFADIFRRNDTRRVREGRLDLPALRAAVPRCAHLHDRAPEDDRAGQGDPREEAEVQRRVSGYSAADEIAKLTQLRDSGAITAEEFEEMKRKAMIQV